MFVRNNRRFNINAFLDRVFVDDTNIQHPGRLLLDPNFRAQHGITEIPDPIRGNDETEYTQEIDVEPWVIITPKSTDQIQAIAETRLKSDVQSYLDEGARALGYDNILSACSYASTPNSFQAEGTSFLNWRSACWEHCNQVVIDVKAGNRAIPTREELIAELPDRV